jgi:membrane peptidoglycan carboxypeptidase
MRSSRRSSRPGTCREDGRPGWSGRQLGLRRGRVPTDRFPSFSSYVGEALDDVLPRHAAGNRGLAIFTTMDLAWQELAEAELDRGLTALDRRLEGALVVMEPGRAAVLAMVGGRRLASGDFNRAFQARRQTGSAIKPIVYAAAFANGLTPATLVSDLRVTYDVGDTTWAPRNLDGVYHPRVTLAKALEKSLNLATTAVVERMDPTRIAEVATHFGLRGVKPVMSIGLGSNEASLLELTNAFCVFAAQGMLRPPSPLRHAVDHRGHVVAVPSRQASQAIPPDIAALMTGLLQNVTRYGVAYPLRHEYAFGRPVAGKTGTTDDYRDAWFVGFTPEIVAGVWVGHDRPASIGREATHVALPLWAHAIGSMLRGFPVTPFASDEQLDWVPMDPWQGCLASAGMRAEWTPFLPGTAPTRYCPPRLLEVDTADTSPDSTAWRGSPDAVLAKADTLGAPRGN